MAEANQVLRELLLAFDAALALHGFERLESLAHQALDHVDRGDVGVAFAARIVLGESECGGNSGAKLIHGEGGIAVAEVAVSTET